VESRDGGVGEFSVGEEMISAKTDSTGWKSS
jgi:hypothetical protein